ncbi:response regulator [Ferviditalea candida]|uniref:Response regulator transcription factor n=1 Tax=Ferviditalea candida TaxID=3108399 RepID=A0ABU5ZJB0_9BACL|nr:response regulator transcription factor [Paenibacillaceae bacterium T2]
MDEVQTIQTNILIVDAEERFRRLLRKHLEKEDFMIDEAADGKTALSKAEQINYDMIVLDTLLPDLSGIDVCEKLRRIKSTPVIMLTAQGEEDDRLRGFQAGADDYVVKPFSPREMIYRVKAVLKRCKTTRHLPMAACRAQIRIHFPNLVIDHDAHRVTVDGREVYLTPTEYDLLYFLASNPNRVFSRHDLLKHVWEYADIKDSRTVDTHIKKLREKLNGASTEASTMISTIWGTGYLLRNDSA